MKKHVQAIFCFCAITCMAVNCNKKQSGSTNEPPQQDSSLVNLSHLNYLYTPVKFSNGADAGGIYIYAEAPDYRLTAATGEGFTCVDDVAIAVLVYIRHPLFKSDTSLQQKAFNLVEFILQMQSDKG